MMRLTRLALLLHLLGSFAVIACAPREPQFSGSVVRVDFAVGCVADTVTFNLSPWIRSIPVDDGVEWNMTVMAGSVDEYGVTPKTPGQWPYVNSGRIIGRRNLPARAQGMKSNPIKGTPTGYTIDLVCVPAGTAQNLRVVIDPDVVVDRTGGTDEQRDQ